MLSENFTRWEILFLQYLKRDWKKIIFWVIGLGLFSSAYVPAFEEIAQGTGAAGMFETMKNPAMISMVGPTPITNGADYTVGAMYAHQMLLFCGMFAAILSLMHVVSHTRKEEDLGLVELVRSFSVGRQANSLAVITETILINLLLAAAISGIMFSFGADSITAEGAALFGLSVGGAGILGGVIGLFFAQLMPNASGATGASLSFIGLLYIARAGTDTTNLDFSWWNPLGLVYLTFPYTKNDWLPFIYLMIFSLVMILIAFFLESKRDLSAGYLPEKEGRREAKRSLLSVPGLFFRLNKGIIIGWSIGFLLMGAAYGSIYGDMQTFLESSELMKQMFIQTGVSLEESFTGTIMMVLASLAAILPIAIVNKLFAEESHGRMSQIFSTKVTRAKLFWTTIGLAFITAVTSLFLSAGSLGGAALSVMDNTKMDFLTFLESGYNFLPIVLFFIGLAAFFLGWAPKAGKIVYIYLGYSFMLNYFGGILDLPDWFAKTAIQSWVPLLPMDDFDLPTFLTITAIGIVLILVGFIGYKKRDMVEGS